jgi:hypothetical protein
MSLFTGADGVVCIILDEKAAKNYYLQKRFESASGSAVQLRTGSEI